jgi:DNA-binding response OmpR family regulator
MISMKDQIQNGKSKVLIVDDDPGILNMYNIVFEKAGYETVILSDGKILLTDQYDIPDIFVLDRQLIGIDGLDICRFLKKNEATKHIPVIMISASPDINTCSNQAGADDYIEKPFKTQTLLDKVAHYLHNASRIAV